MPKTISISRRLLVARLGLSFLFVLFIVAGSIASIQTGLTWDEQIEQSTFGIVGNAAKQLAHGDPTAIEGLQGHGDKYYGVGFHALAYPYQLLLRSSVERSFGLDATSSLLLAKHPAVFSMFALSVIAFYRLLRILVRHRMVALLFAAAYASYPYLFGHGMFNVKDMPYMSVYLLCTYLSIRMAQHHLAGKKESFTPDLVLLLVATAFLTSIRIPGLIILVQYLVTFAAADAAARQMGVSSTPLLRLTTVLGFPMLLLGLVIAVYPAFWLDPIHGIPDALNYMRRHPWSGCTLTWGECMRAQWLPPTYIPGWLVVKLPIFVLLGLVCTPFVLKRIVGAPLDRVAVVTLLFGSLFPLAAAIVLRTPFYDETRHSLFVYPLLFLLASIALYAVSRQLALVAGLLSLAVFAWDQVQLHPYQYVYFNEAARFLNIDKLFETDYWGASGRELGGMVAERARTVEDLDCVYANPSQLFRPFIDQAICVKGSDPLTAQSPPVENYLIATLTRWQGSKPFETLPNCSLAAEVVRTFPLSNRKVTMAVAYRCQPL